MTRFIICLLVVLLLGSASIAPAQTVRMLRVSAGTGFVINNDGNLITNNHVVRECQSINVLTTLGERPAQLVASDPEHDLAVLKISDLGGSGVAPLRWNIHDLKPGDPVELIGFPGQEGIQGHYSFRKTSVTNMQGPQGEPRWIQLASVAQHGNSGGPVLDTAGNVIGVITGVAQTFKIGSDGQIGGQPIGQADVAITLVTLQDFLHTSGIPYYESVSNGIDDDSAIVQNALKFTLPVRCVQGAA